MRKGDKVRVVSHGGGNCPEIGTVGTVVRCVITSALIDFDGILIWCRYSEIRAVNEIDDFLNEWEV